jgi:hypothetical protein
LAHHRAVDALAQLPVAHPRQQRAAKIGEAIDIDDAVWSAPAPNGDGPALPTMSAPRYGGLYFEAKTCGQVAAGLGLSDHTITTRINSGLRRMVSGHAEFGQEP